MSFIIAIDGPAGTGKGTITKLVSKELGLINIDTGAMYRCIALEALRNNINDTQLEIIEEKILKDIKIEFKIKNNEIITVLNGEDVSDKIRTPQVDRCVAKFAALKCVREQMTNLQKNMKNLGNIIMEGRDIGTTVFPDANVKIYLDASVEERARRRYKQNLEKGIKDSYDAVLESIKQRHILETTRKISPLKKADDAILVDTTNLNVEQVKEKVIDIIKEKLDA